MCTSLYLLARENLPFLEGGGTMRGVTEGARVEVGEEGGGERE